MAITPFDGTKPLLILNEFSMLNIKITEDELEIRGHADYAPHGFDIVCAAATILSYTAAECGKNAAAQEWLKEKPIINLKPGHIKICCAPKAAHSPEIHAVFRSLRSGFQILGENYPKSVLFPPDTAKFYPCRSDETDFHGR